jgi:hypothetical protein
LGFIDFEILRSGLSKNAKVSTGRGPEEDVEDVDDDLGIFVPTRSVASDSIPARPLGFGFEDE